MNEHWWEVTIQRGFESIKDIYSRVEGRGFIAGSYAAFMAYKGPTPVMPNDLDIFATSHANALAIGHDIALPLKSQYAAPSEFTGVAIRLGKVNGIDVQIIDPNPAWKVWPDDLLEDFDLSVCRALLKDSKSVLCDVDAGGPWGKVLRVNNPLRSLKRVMKYAARGVEFPDRELLKLFEAWDQTKAERKAEIIRQATPEPVFDYSFDYDEDDWFEGE